MLYTLLITDEVATGQDRPCLDDMFVAEFMSFHPIFGAILVEDPYALSPHNVSLPLFIDSIGCLLDDSLATNNRSASSIVESNSAVSPADNFRALFDSVQSINLWELNLSPDECNVMADNVSWPGIEFEDILSSNGMAPYCFVVDHLHIVAAHIVAHCMCLSECADTDLSLSFVIDLTMKYENGSCFECWIDTISSMIMYGFTLMQQSAHNESALRVALITFDDVMVTTYRTLDDPAITDYAQLSQTLSLVQSLTPSTVDSAFSPFGIDAALDTLMSTAASSNYFVFIDDDEVLLLDSNSSLDCSHFSDSTGIRGVYRHEALEYHLYPLHRFQCDSVGNVLAIEDASILAISGSTTNFEHNEAVLTQLYIGMKLGYCPRTTQQCYDCGIPLYDTSLGRNSFSLSPWRRNEPITAG